MGTLPLERNFAEVVFLYSKLTRRRGVRHQSPGLTIGLGRRLLRNKYPCSRIHIPIPRTASSCAAPQFPRLPSSHYPSTSTDVARFPVRRLLWLCYCSASAGRCISWQQPASVRGSWRNGKLRGLGEMMCSLSLPWSGTLLPTTIITDTPAQLVAFPILVITSFGMRLPRDLATVFRTDIFRHQIRLWQTYLRHSS